MVFKIKSGVPFCNLFLFFQKPFVEKSRPTMELKDVPPPPTPLLQPCTAPFPLSKIQPPSIKQLQLQAGPKVSCCAHCSSGTSDRFTGSGYIRPNPIVEKNTAATVTCQISPGTSFASEVPFNKMAVTSSYRTPPSSYSNVYLEKRLSPCQFLPPHPVPCFTNVHLNQFHSDLHKLQVTSLGTSTGYCTCSDFTGGATRHLKEHLAQSHFCTGPLHLNSAPSVFLKSSSFCESCLEKVCLSVVHYSRM